MKRRAMSRGGKGNSSDLFLCANYILQQKLRAALLSREAASHVAALRLGRLTV